MVQKHWIALALLLLTLVCFGHACLCDFVNWDDRAFVTDNPYVPGGLTGANIRGAFTTQYGGWIPLTYLSLQLDATLFGARAAWGFHLTNLLMHAVSVVLFFHVLDRMTGELWPSAICAALFAIHPLRVESVVWIAERRDVLCVLMGMVTLAAFQFYTERPGWGRYALVVLSFGLGLAAKQMLVTLPFVLLLLDYWPLYRLRLEQAAPAAAQVKPVVSWKLVVLEKMPLLAMALVVSLFLVQDAAQAGGLPAGIPWQDRLAVSLAGYLGYLEKTIWPMNLAALYPFRIPHWSIAALAAGLLAAITITFVYFGRSRPMLLVGWLWFVGTLFPASGWIQVGAHALADRYSYLPHMGLLIAVVWGIGGLTVWQQANAGVRKLVVGLVLMTLGTLTWLQVWHWENSETLYRYTLSVTENNALFHVGYGRLLDARGSQKEAEGNVREAQEDFTAAEYHLARAIDIVPTAAEFNLDFGALMVRRGKHHAAIDPLQAVVRLEPRSSMWTADANYLLGIAFDKLGRRDEAREYLRKSIECWESAPPLDLRTGRVPKTRKVSPHIWLCEMTLRAGEPNQTLAHVETLLAIKPDLMEGYRLKGIALGRVGRWKEAEEALQIAVNLPPQNPSNFGYLAYAYARQDKKELAAREYESLLNRFPGWLPGSNDFAMLCLTKAAFLDPLKAEELALQLCEATHYQDPRSLDTLAAALAAKGDFAGARQKAGEAIRLVSDPALKQQMEGRLHLYENNQPLFVPEKKQPE